LLIALAVAGCASTAWVASADTPQASASSTDAPRALPSATEARRQAELLHESFHATLQAVHHQYFREDEGIVIPAVTLKRVFRELARHQNIEVRWLAVNAQAMNVDHEPRDEFEKQAVKALAAGADQFEQTEGGVYRRVGPIVLESDCLKCHMPTRTSVDERLAGLLIALPVKVD
jgi:hypothetical protein